MEFLLVQCLKVLKKQDMELCCIKNINITKVNGKKVSNKDWVF